MKKIIRPWALATGMMLLHTQTILAQQATKLTDDNFNVEGWMFLGAGIAICFAGILLFVMNKLVTKTCIKEPKKETQKANQAVKHQSKPKATKSSTQHSKPKTRPQMASEVKQPKREAGAVGEVERLKTRPKEQSVPERHKTPRYEAPKYEMPKYEMPKRVTAPVKPVVPQTKTHVAPAKPSTMHIQLVEVSNPVKRIQMSLHEQVKLGRNPKECQVVIEDDFAVSGVHCMFYLFNEEVYVMDLGSTNGTYVNGQMIHYAVVLKEGDHLDIGSKEYRIMW